MNAVSAIEPWQGKVIEGKYPLLELVGSGPRGPVFRTELSTPKGPQAAAIKLIPIEGKNAEAELARLRAAMGLTHPNLIKIFDVGQSDIRRQPTIYVVTEFADENLAQVLPSRALSAGEVERMLPPLISAVSFLHQNRYVHGRLQPSNVMAVGETLKLSSDSIRKIDNVTGPGRAEENGYSTPHAATNIPADIGAFGALLVSALATEAKGQPSAQQLTLLPGSVPEPFRRIARECLRANPADRCTLDQIKVWLSTKQPAETVAARETPAAAGVSSPIKRIAIPLAVAVVLLGIWLAFGSHSKAPQSAAPPATAPSAQTTPPLPTQKGTVAGAVADRAMPNVSLGARNTIHGKIRVAVRVEVDSAGNVTDAKLTSPGPSRYFANKALESARKWKFTAPQVDGQPTASAWLLKYQFGRSGTEVLPSESQ